MSYTRISILRLVQGAQAAFGGGDGSEETLGIGECLGCESEEDEVITMAPVQHAIAGATGARSELAQAEVAPRAQRSCVEIRVSSRTRRASVAR